MQNVDQGNHKYVPPYLQLLDREDPESIHWDLIVVGAGPAGLTAALEAQSNGLKTLIIEKDSQYVGGISRTVERGGYRFDIGGHRFFSKSPEVTQWWKDRLPDDFISVKRMSRIYYNGKYFDYPIKPINALKGLGIWTSFLCMISYGWSNLFPKKPEESFADWVSNRFGKKLFSIFFKTYTEKVWGMPCDQISADWAAQRIKGLSLLSAVLNAFKGKGKKGSGEVIKTLIDTFEYPKMGPGQMWEHTAAEILRKGGSLLMGNEVVKFETADDGNVSQVVCRNQNGDTVTCRGREVIVSMPLQETVRALKTTLPPEAQTAASALKYRDFLTVALVVEGENPFPDNWIYIHDPSVKMGRIQNYLNWSPHLIGRQGTTCLGLEYFCFEGDGLWSMADEDLIELGKKELVKLGLVDRDRIQEGYVVRMEKAYPVYDETYQSNVESIAGALSKIPNLQPVGRNGMHKYNNQDHSMMTGLLSARNLKGRKFDTWKVNTDAEYQEEERKGENSGRMVPQSVSSQS